MDGACVVECDEGYSTMSASTTAKCQANGEWDIDTTDLCQSKLLLLCLAT